MIKLIKIGNLIYQGFEEKSFDENGKEIWNIPTDVKAFRKIVIDTINWKIGQDIKSATQDYTRLSASNSKAIIIVLKLLTTLNPDTTGLTDKEKSAYDKMLTLAQNGYGDSDLLNTSLDAVLNGIQTGQTLITNALNASSIEELIGILNELEV